MSFREDIEDTGGDQRGCLGTSIILVAVIMSFMLLLGLSIKCNAQTIIGRQRAITLQTTPWASGVTGALVWLPKDYNPANTYPLIISLHGVGQDAPYSSVNNDSVSLSKIPANSGSVSMYIAKGWDAKAINPVDGNTYEFIVISPQASSWSYGEQQINYMLPQIEKLYSVDKNRIYVTGYSAGGWGTWTCVTDDTSFTKQIAAIVPMSAATLEPTRVPKVLNAVKFNIPVWDIMNNTDINGFTPPNINYVDSIKKHGGNARITFTLGTGHNAWINGCNPAWADTFGTQHLNIYSWMLQYSKNAVTPTPVPVPTPTPTPVPIPVSSTIIHPFIYKDATIHLDGRTTTIHPGDTILLSSAQRSVGYITLSDIYGLPGKPVVITDDGNFWDTASNVSTNGISITNCRYLKIIGSSHDSTKLSFHLDGSRFAVSAGRGGGGISISGTSADIEIGYIDIENKDEGIIIKQEIACGDSLQYPNSIMHNFYIHNNLIRGMIAEGMYIGSTDPDNNITTAKRAHYVICNGDTAYPLPLRMDSILIEHNILDSIGRSGIQVSGAETGRNWIDSNDITRCGYEFNPSGQGCGISIGSYDNNFRIYGNRIFRTFTSGIQAFPIGQILIYNNWIDSSGVLDGHNSNSSLYGNVRQASITLDTRPTFNPSGYKTSFVIFNNSLGYNEDTNIRIYNTNNSYEPSGNYLIQNLVLPENAKMAIDPSVKYYY